MDDRVREPGDPTDGERRTRWPLALAVLVAIVLGSLAPDDWETGAAHVEVSYRGSTVLRAPVELGDTTPVEAAAESGAAFFALSAERGFPVDAPIELAITATTDATISIPSLGVARLDLGPDEAQSVSVRAVEPGSNPVFVTLGGRRTERGAVIAVTREAYERTVR